MKKFNKLIKWEQNHLRPTVDRLFKYALEKGNFLSKQKADIKTLKKLL